MCVYVSMHKSRRVYVCICVHMCVCLNLYQFWEMVGSSLIWVTKSVSRRIQYECHCKNLRKWYWCIISHKQMYDGVTDMQWFALFGIRSYATHVFVLLNACNASGKAISVCIWIIHVCSNKPMTHAISFTTRICLNPPLHLIIVSITLYAGFCYGNPRSLSCQHIDRNNGY